MLHKHECYFKWHMKEHNVKSLGPVPFINMKWLKFWKIYIINCFWLDLVLSEMNLSSPPLLTPPLLTLLQLIPRLWWGCLSFLINICPFFFFLTGALRLNPRSDQNHHQILDPREYPVSCRETFLSLTFFQHYLSKISHSFGFSSFHSVYGFLFHTHCSVSTVARVLLRSALVRETVSIQCDLRAGS